MNCKHCGHKLENDVKVCNQCGQSVEMEKSKKGWIIFAVAAGALFFAAFSFDVYRQRISGDAEQNINNYSKADFINAAVKEAKDSLNLPKQIDESTKLVDITAEPNAIRYHYIISAIDTSKLSNDSLKSYLVSSVCQNADTKSILDREINMEYSYIVENSTQTYFVSVTKADCL